MTHDFEPATSMVTFLTAAWRRRAWLVGLPTAVAFFVAVLAILGTRPYTATMSFTSAGGSGALGGVAGVAADLGVALPGGGGNDSPEFFAEVIQSQAFLDHLVDSAFVIMARGTQTIVQLDTIFGQPDPNPAVTRRIAAIRLGRQMRVSVSPTTGIVRVSLSTFPPELAEAIVKRVLDHLLAFNAQAQQERAREDKSFIASQLEEAQAFLRAAEDSASLFIARNRDVGNAPRLQFELDRVRRQVAFRQGVVTTLAQSLEQARIDAVRNGPALTIVEEPGVSPIPDRRRLLLKVLLGWVGTIVVVCAGWLGEAVLRQSVHGEEQALATLQVEMQTSAGWIGRLVRWILARVRGRNS